MRSPIRDRLLKFFNTFSSLEQVLSVLDPECQVQGRPWGHIGPHSAVTAAWAEIAAATAAPPQWRKKMHKTVLSAAMALAVVGAGTSTASSAGATLGGQSLRPAIERLSQVDTVACWRDG